MKYYINHGSKYNRATKEFSADVDDTSVYDINDKQQLVALLEKTAKYLSNGERVRWNIALERETVDLSALFTG